MEERVLFDGQIKVNTLGQVFKSTYGFWREVAKPNGGKNYRVVGVIKDGWSKAIPVHRLVAMTFIPNPENKPEVNHINGDKQDNRVENLEWVTHSENVKHAYRTGLNKGIINTCTMCGKETRNQKYRGLCTCSDCRKKYGIQRVTKPTTLAAFAEHQQTGIWYACMGNSRDFDWSYGSMDVREAIKMAKRDNAERIDVVTAVNNSLCCIDRLYREDFDRYL